MLIWLTEVKVSLPCQLLGILCGEPPPPNSIPPLHGTGSSPLTTTKTTLLLLCQPTKLGTKPAANVPSPSPTASPWRHRECLWGKLQPLLCGALRQTDCGHERSTGSFGKYFVYQHSPFNHISPVINVFLANNKRGFHCWVFWISSLRVSSSVGAALIQVFTNMKKSMPALVDFICRICISKSWILSMASSRLEK